MLKSQIFIFQALPFSQLPRKSLFRMTSVSVSVFEKFPEVSQAQTSQTPELSLGSNCKRVDNHMPPHYSSEIAPTAAVWIPSSGNQLPFPYGKQNYFLLWHNYVWCLGSSFSWELILTDVGSNFSKEYSQYWSGTTKNSDFAMERNSFSSNEDCEYYHFYRNISEEARIPH